MRFLKYSLEKQKPIKAVIMNEGTIIQKTIRVQSLQDDGFYYTISNRKKEHYCEYKNLLACSYARGDDEAKL